MRVTRLPWPPLAIIYNPVFDTPSFHLTLLVSSHITCYYHHSLTQQHTNKENIVFQNISPNNTYKHKTYCFSEHLTQQHIQTQNILSFRTSHIATHTNTKYIVFRTSHPTTHTNTKHIVLQNISPNNTYKHKTYCFSEHLTQQKIQTQNILSFRTAHQTKHTNTKHIVLQNISPNQTHKHKTCRSSEHPTQQNTTQIVGQNLPLVVNISTYHILYTSGIFFVIKM